MSLKKFHDHQPNEFEFSNENLKKSRGDFKKIS